MSDRRLVIAWLVGLAGCAASETPPLPPLEASLPDGAAPDRPGLPDATALRELRADQPRTPDLASCALGTPDHCQTCGVPCLPGHDPTSAIRVCLAGGKCELQCLEEAYDVDGVVGNGCEVVDDLPIHDLESAARALGAVGDCDNPVQATALLPSDARTHVKSPNDRPNGRADWFSLHVQDKPGCVVNATVSVSLAGVPSAIAVRATAYWRCDDGTKLAAVSQTGAGGSTLTLDPSTGCTWIGDDTGTLFLEVRKQSGPHTAQSYTVSIEP